MNIRAKTVPVKNCLDRLLEVIFQLEGGHFILGDAKIAHLSSKLEEGHIRGT